MNRRPAGKPRASIRKIVGDAIADTIGIYLWLIFLGVVLFKLLDVVLGW
jgi:hypothetical protein